MKRKEHKRPGHVAKLPPKISAPPDRQGTYRRFSRRLQGTGDEAPAGAECHRGACCGHHGAPLLYPRLGEQHLGGLEANSAPPQSSVDLGSPGSWGVTRARPEQQSVQGDRWVAPPRAHTCRLRPLQTLSVRPLAGQHPPWPFPPPTHQPDARDPAVTAHPAQTRAGSEAAPSVLGREGTVLCSVFGSPGVGVVSGGVRRNSDTPQTGPFSYMPRRGKSTSHRTHLSEFLG